MKIQIILLILLTLCLFETIVIAYPIIKGTPIFTNTSISIDYDITNNTGYYYRWEFRNSYATSVINYRLEFTCKTQQTNVMNCYKDIDENIHKKLSGIVSGCYTDPYGNEDCRDLRNYPTPIVKNFTSPSTKGGNVVINGYYLKFGLPIKDDFTISSPDTPLSQYGTPDDPTNITLDYKGGCGERSFKWNNGQFYAFNHSSPNITNSNINQNQINIIGTNFCNDTNKVKVYFNGSEIDKSIIFSVNHELIQISYNDQNAKTILFKVNAGGLDSNEYTFKIGPSAIRINSVPSTGGNVTIFGERFTAIDKNSKKVIIGISNCNVKYSDSDQIICTLGPKPAGSGSDNLPITIEIDKISNTPAFTFSYDKPYIRGYLLSNDGTLTLIGDCFGGTSTWVYLNDVKQQQISFTRTGEYLISFKLSNSFLNYKPKLFISIDEVKSNIVVIDATLKLEVVSNSNDLNSISVIGQTIYYELNGIYFTNIESLPMITILSNVNTPSIQGKIIKRNPYDPSSITYSFNIPKGCGKETLQISIGDQSTTTEINYETPIITSCSIIGNTANCNGEFTNFISYFNNGQLSMKFSNEIIETNEIQIQESYISFPLKSNYLTGDIQIELCNIQSDPYNLFIPPIYESFLNSSKTLNTTGGIIIINGNHFNESFVTSTYFDCLVDSSSKKFNCKYNSFDSISCNLEMNGPIDKSCNFTFNNQIIESPLLFGYYPPSITNVTTLINPIDGGNITIIGNEFYDNIDSISINDINCINSIFINSTVIHCLIGPILNHKSSTLYNVTITINGKTATKNNINIFPFGIPSNSSDNTDSNNNGKYKLFGIIVILPFLALILYGCYKKYLKAKKHEDDNKRMFKNAHDMDAREEQRIIEEAEQLRNGQKVPDTPSISNSNTIEQV